MKTALISILGLAITGTTEFAQTSNSYLNFNSSGQCDGWVHPSEVACVKSTATAQNVLHHINIAWMYASPAQGDWYYISYFVSGRNSQDSDGMVIIRNVNTEEIVEAVIRTDGELTISEGSRDDLVRWAPELSFLNDALSDWRTRN